MGMGRGSQCKNDDIWTKKSIDWLLWGNCKQGKPRLMWRDDMTYQNF